jgi:hypothetical protein
MNRAAIALVLLALAQPGVGQVQEDERARRAELARVRKAQGEGAPGVADAVIGLASSLEAQGRTRAVEDLYRLEIDVSRKNADKGNTRVLSLAFTEWLLRAEDWRLSDTRSLIGETLVAQKKFAAAESLLVEAQKELAAAVEAPTDTRKRAIRRLVDLYEAWERTSPGQGKMAEAARWRTRL